MQFDAIQFYNHVGVSYMTEGHKHCQPGWVQVPCPFCTGSPGWHLGYQLTGGFYNCWRCGFHSSAKVIRGLLVCDWAEAYKLLKQFQTASPFRPERVKVKKRKFKMPVGTKELGPHHIHYLRKRRFKPYTIAKLWDLVGTGPVGRYKHRIIAPITYNGQVVSYQGRDVTERHELKYKACDEAGEVIHHKNILYGLDNSIGDTCVLVEGIFDAWRLGPGAVAGFGIKIKESQIQILAERFKRVFIMFDDDPEAVQQSYKIGHKLIHLGCSVELLFIEGDPGALSNKKAAKYMRQIFD